MRKLSWIGIVLVVCTTGYGQNLLLNPSFEDPAVENPECNHPSGYGGAVDNWTGLTNRNNSFYGPGCYHELMFASMTGWGTSEQSFSQAVTTSITPGTVYTLSGVWSAGHMDSYGYNTCTAELRDGDAPSSPLLAQAQLKQGSGSSPWTAFSVNGTPTGTAITVVLRTSNSGGTGYALHVDALDLAQATCLNPPTVDTIDPAFGVRDATVNMTITGSNFVSGSTSVTLTRTGSSDIVASGVSVGAGGTSLTCSVDLTGAHNGRWNVIVNVTGENCTPVTVNDAFLVVLPSVSNGSFELPSAPGACPAVPIAGVPTDWLFREIASYGYEWALFRDSDRSPPTCPPPDGDHYGSSISNNDGGAGAEAWVYQFLSATPGTTYTFYGQFAGAGRNTVTIELYDGDLSAPVIGSSTVHNPTEPAYDWSPAAATASPTGNYMTAAVHVKLNGDAPHAAHFDNLAIGVCASPISITGMTPLQAVNGGTINATISGSGFAGSPVIQLVKPGSIVTATNVNVVSAGEITCDFDLSAASSGKYKLFMLQNACVAEYLNALQVIAQSFINGSFELPENAQTPCTGTIVGLPTGWNTDAPSGLNRDGQAPPPNPCPSPDGGHYGSMSEGSGGTVRAWQTVQVSGGNYEFSGLFNVPAGVTVTLRLLDGDESGTQLAESSVPVEVNTWTEGSVNANAPTSGIMTAVWEMQLTGTEPAVGGSADGLKFESTCNNPVFDFDGDGDVDQTDFAAFQVCYTGGTGPLPAGCECADRTGDGLVTQSDATAFEACASGPGIPANPDCD